MVFPIFGTVQDDFVRPNRDGLYSKIPQLTIFMVHSYQLAIFWTSHSLVAITIFQSQGANRDPEERRDKVFVYDYDCILLDIMLPDGSGLQLLEQLKK